MNKKQRKIYDDLTYLELIWDKELMLYVNNGAVMLVHYETKEVLGQFPGIVSDSGDTPVSETADGKEYLDLD